MSHRHLLCKHQYNCDDTDHSHRHLLCKHQYNCDDTDNSHRHLLCRHQYNCGDTDHSHRHLLCKHQYNCGDTDHSHRHLLCKHQYNCGARTQFDTLSGPLQTRSPLWRALRRHRKRLRTLANGCGRKRKTWRTQPHPQTPKWNGNPRYAFGKNTIRQQIRESRSHHDPRQTNSRLSLKCQNRVLQQFLSKIPMQTLRTDWNHEISWNSIIKFTLYIPKGPQTKITCEHLLKHNIREVGRKQQGMSWALSQLKRLTLADQTIMVPVRSLEQGPWRQGKWWNPIGPGNSICTRNCSAKKSSYMIHCITTCFQNICSFKPQPATSCIKATHIFVSRVVKEPSAPPWRSGGVKVCAPKTGRGAHSWCCEFRSVFGADMYW